MEQKKIYGIQEVSKLMDIPKATIRYWDSKGLIAAERNRQNDYREFSLQAALNLGNVSFFRSIGMPIKEVREILQASVARQEEMLLDREQSIAKKKRELELQEARIRKQIHELEEVRRLKDASLEPGRPEFTKAIAFSNEKESHWRKMTEEPWSFVLVFEADGETYRYGIGYLEGEQQEPEEEILWERKEALYYQGLLVTDNWEEGKNNLSRVLSTLPSGKQPKGKVLARFLTSEALGQELMDYYKLWIEVS